MVESIVSIEQVSSATHSRIEIDRALAEFTHHEQDLRTFDDVYGIHKSWNIGCLHVPLRASASVVT